MQMGEWGDLTILLHVAFRDYFNLLKSDEGVFFTMVGE
jgi:hypothetical protein